MSCASCKSAATVRCDGADGVDSAASDGELEWAGTCSSKSPASCTSVEQTLLPPSASSVARAAHEVMRAIAWDDRPFAMSFLCGGHALESGDV